MTAFVVVEFPTTRLVIEARVATREEIKELVEVELTEVRLVKLPLVAEKLFVKKFVELLLVAVRLVIVAFVVVEFPTMRSVIEAKVATRDEKNPLVLVLLVENRFVAVRAEAEAVLSVV